MSYTNRIIAVHTRGGTNFMFTQRGMIPDLKHKHRQVDDRKYWRTSNSWIVVSEEYRGDRNLMMKAVKTEGNALYYASDELKNDLELVMTAWESNPCSFQYASEQIRGDKDVFLKLLHETRGVGPGVYLMEWATDSIRNDKTLGITSLQFNPSILEFLGDELKNDTEVVLMAVRKKGDVLKYASDRLKGDESVVCEALSNGCTVKPECISERLRLCRKVVLHAVKSSPSNLTKNLEKAFLGDREIVTAAVRKDGLLLRFADMSLKDES